VALTGSHAEYTRLFVRHRWRHVIVPVADLRHLKAPA
jgi:hypothetical protein